MAHRNHNFIVCEARLVTLFNRIEKLMEIVDVARLTSQEQTDKAQRHIVKMKKQIRDEKLAQEQEERLISELERAATRLNKEVSLAKDEQRLAKIYLHSLRLLTANLWEEGGIDDQRRFLPCLEKDVEKRWRTDIPGVAWWKKFDPKKINASDIDNLKFVEVSFRYHINGTPFAPDSIFVFI